MPPEQFGKLMNYITSTLTKLVESYDEPLKINLAVAKKMSEFHDHGLIHGYTATRLENLEMFDLVYCSDLKIWVAPDLHKSYRFTVHRSYD